MDNPTDAPPFVFDPTGRDVLGEADRLRALGPVTLVELPDGVRAWAVNDQGLLRKPLVDPHASPLRARAENISRCARAQCPRVRHRAARRCGVTAEKALSASYLEGT